MEMNVGLYLFFDDHKLKRYEAANLFVRFSISVK